MTAPAPEALGRFAEHLQRVELPLPTPGAADGRREVDAARTQLADHVMARLASLDAPLLVVIGGSTGAGKSTLTNALIGRGVTRAGAIRPTTRRPILVHHPDDAAWFEGGRILPGLARVRGTVVSDETPAPSAAADAEDVPATSLVLLADDAVPRGLALLDAPDIDSVSAGNRELARQLLRAADLWLFVTTANRYADAVPWELLHSAAARDVTVAVVMNRIPPRTGVAEELAEDLRGMLERDGLGAARLFLVTEGDLDEDGMLEAEKVQEIRSFFSDLASDADERGAIARRTLAGALDGLARTARDLAEHVAEQERERERLATDIDRAFARGRENIDTAVGDGSLLRGEVLARWQDVVGTGEFFRTVEGVISRLRDRVGAFFSGEQPPTEAAESALETGLVHVVVEETARSAERVETAWRAGPAGRHLLGTEDLARLPEEYSGQVAAAVRAWQSDVLELVRTEGADRRTKARILSFGVNAVGVALMIVVFASTAFIPTGLELGVGAGAAVVGQKLLETLFGDEAVRRMAATARERLTTRLDALVDERAEPFRERIAEAASAVGAADLTADAAALENLAAHVRGGQSLDAAEQA
ncbi:MAG: dynamin family protein [Brachybacterium sp.]|nr:dynamin family protein [Brachybacterium sp.]